MTSLHAGALWPMALLVATGCMPDSVSPGYYGVTDEAGAVAADPASVGASPGDHPSTGDARDDGASAPADDAGSAKTPSASKGGCDLGGRWLATDREVATGLGAVEAAHTWLYYEIDQTGSDFTVTRGLDCGESTLGISSVSANVDYHKAWPSITAKALHTGRKGTSKASSGGCSVAFAKQYQIIGATISAYLNPSQTMPMPSEEAASGRPGWEDWDADGHPGITMSVTGLATGQIYVAIRRWNMFSGTVATGASTFTLADDWNSEQDLLGYDGSQLLTAATSGARVNDDTAHFVTFVRLDASQATGDDATTCAAVRKLAPGLTPKASM